MAPPVDTPRAPAPELTADQIRSVLAAAHRSADVRAVTCVDGGFINTIYRVQLAGEEPPLALRVYSGGVDALEKERRVLERARPTVPVPEVLFADTSGRVLPQPYVVYRWIDGENLNDCRRREPPSVLLGLAEPLGRLAAGVAACPSADILPASPTASTALVRAETQLRGGPARRRLGDALADALRARLDSAAPLLEAADRPTGLVHGDFGGRNILVASRRGGAWRVVGLIDWESAFSGGRLWDVGSLFRYSRRYPPEFRDRFAGGYHAGGEGLPDDWYLAARLLDSTRLVEMLSDEREVAGFFAELRAAIEVLVREEGVSGKGV